MKVSLRTLKYIGFSLVLMFSDILHNGNLNLIYLFGVFIIFRFLIKKKYFYHVEIRYLIPFLSIVLMFIIFTDQPFSMIKMFVYSGKLFINIALLLFFQYNFSEKNIREGMKYILATLSLLLTLALIFHNNNIFWRLNDPFNSFSKTRLQLLFSEPSVLGLFVGTLLIFSFYSFLEFGIDRLCMIGVVVPLICLVLSFSLSAIVYTAIVILYLVAKKILKAIPTKKLNERILVLIILIMMMMFFIMITENPVRNRVLAILNGTDGSFNFRWNAATQSLFSILEKTNYLGLGFGNMNTEYGRSILESVGMSDIFANSFLYFIAEAGILGVFYIVFIINYCIKNIRKNKYLGQDDCKELKQGLLIYVFISQIAGGYFTDPFIWCLYGIICAKNLKKSGLKI